MDREKCFFRRKSRIRKKNQKHWNTYQFQQKQKQNMVMPSALHSNEKSFTEIDISSSKPELRRRIIDHFYGKVKPCDENCQCYLDQRFL